MSDKLYYQENKARILAYQASYRATHKEKIKQRQHAYYIANRPYMQEKQKEQSHRYYLKNKEKELAKSKAQQKARRDIVRQAKNKPCMDCGISYPPYVMDLDHRPGVIKIDKVSNLVRYDTTKVLAEIEKCDVVCANCHRIRTFQRLEQAA